MSMPAVPRLAEYDPPVTPTNRISFVAAPSVVIPTPSSKSFRAVGERLYKSSSASRISPHCLEEKPPSVGYPFTRASFTSQDFIFPLTPAQAISSLLKNYSSVACAGTPHLAPILGKLTLPFIVFLLADRESD